MRHSDGPALLSGESRARQFSAERKGRSGNFALADGMARARAVLHTTPARFPMTSAAAPNSNLHPP